MPKPLWQRWHQSPCGISAQRDLYSAFLAAYLDPPEFLPSCAQQRYAASWEGAEPRLRAAYEVILQRASAGQPLSRSVTYPRRPSASASKSKPSDTRARLPSQADGKRGSKARNLRGFSPERFQYGQQGWELVSIQPVIVGGNGDILITDRTQGYNGRWTSTYLCTFKRPKGLEASFE